MEFGLLGPVEVRVDGATLPLGAAKQRALLALLLLDANRTVARERLIDGLWGDDPPESAVKGIQLYVSNLRKLLPPGTIVTQPSGYLVEIEPERIDLVRFERLVASARKSDPATAARRLRQALELWRGPPLTEFGDVAFFRNEARRLEELRLAALEDRVDADLALGRHAELVGELDALIAQQAHRERLRSQLMLALYRSGRQAEALEAYRDAHTALDELGLEPSARLKDLERLILTQDASLELRPTSLFATDRVPVPGPLVPTPPFAFVGRTPELAALRSALAQARDGEGGVVLLGGEAGGGKTRLIRELAHGAADDGVLVCYGCSDAAVVTPYQPLREWLGFLVRTCEPEVLGECLGSTGGELARLVPEVGGLTTRPLPPPRDPESDRFALHGAVTELFAKLSRLQPVLLAADDVHWADGETLQLLLRLARFAPEARVLIVAAFRDRSEDTNPQFPDRLAELERLDGTTELALGNLSTDEIGEFIGGSANADASYELVAAIEGLTDGTPLLLCELWRELRDSDAVEVTRTARLTKPLSELRGPDRVRDGVRLRLSRLGAETVALLELGAVAGPQFELKVVAAAAGVEPAALAGSAEEAVRSGIIEELPDPALAHRFTHELVRRAVYDRLTGLRRAELHLRVGEALECLYSAELEQVVPELAHHFTLAASVGGSERAVEYNLRAADAAVASAALEDAAASLARALAVGVADRRERVRVQIELAWLLAESGQTTEARSVLAKALRGAVKIGERGLEAQARVMQAWPDWLGVPRYDIEERRRTAEAAIATFSELGDARGLALARHLLAYAYRGDGQCAAAAAELERALLDAERSGHPPTRSRVVSQLVQMLCLGPASAEEAIRRCEELRRTHAGETVLEATIDRGLSLLYAMAAQGDDASECDRRSREVLDQLDYHTQAYFLLYAAEAQRLLGNAAAAECDLLAVWRRFGGDDRGAQSLQALTAARDLAWLSCDQGRWDEAERWLLEAGHSLWPIALTGPSYPASMLVFAAMARLASHRGESGDALALAKRAVEVGAPSDFLNWKADASWTLAEAQRAAGHDGDTALATALTLYEQKGNVAAAGSLRMRAEAGFKPASTR